MHVQEIFKMILCKHAATLLFLVIIFYSNALTASVAYRKQDAFQTLIILKL